MGKNQWVVHHDNKWAVRGEGNSRVTKCAVKPRALALGI